ncbi:RGPA1-like protein [Mya arenaria]|uniref:RGPA1-like protein n=1 Tax=Mya arenaria TaxID=6604 RepID=A0ABY7FAK3_MYAAR|nr:RGPA1-like protein [Mya arenaria]
MDISGASSVASERSETDTVTRRSRSPSPTSAHYRSGTRTPSPTPSSELGVDLPCQHKDSPTPDRDSLHIEMVAGNEQQNRGSLEEFKSVLAGGTCQGWLPDVSVILWRRMLGALGDVNKIDDPAIHASVFEHLCYLQETLSRMRDNMGVTVDNQSSPTPPELIPPQTIFSSWLFECLTLSNKYKRGKLLAYQLLCQMMIRPPDLTLSPDLLAHFYHVLHQGLNQQDQYTGPRLFYTPLPGNTMLILDMVTAIESIIISAETPRLEAISILGCLVCFPNHYKDIPLMHNDLERVTVKSDVIKDHVLRLLLKAGKREPAGLARCIAVSSLGIFLYEEITHGTLHSKFVESVMCNTVCLLVPAAGQVQSEEERRLMLNVTVTGHTSTSIETAGRCVGELWTDQEYENLRKIPASSPNHLHGSDSTGSLSSQAKHSPEDSKSPAESDPVKLAVLCVKPKNPGIFHRTASIDARTLHGLSMGGDTEPLVGPEEKEVVTMVSQRPRTVSDLPTFENTHTDHDNLFDLLGYIGHTSPECLLIPGVPLNIEAPIPEDLNEHAEILMRGMVLEQQEAELDYFNKHKNDASMLARPQMPTEIQDPSSPFQMCRMLIDQMGFLSWDNRCQFDLLKKTDKLLREIKNMDAQKCRETHKFAVIYVAEGQEDKNSILSNPGSSAAFEHFVAGLGWEVDLEMHKGFLGGLQQNKTTGDTAPYFATPTLEIVYHVSTRIPEGSEESRHIKMRHLGNDEVHIVWSEHTRDYRRGIIPTEFGDVLIIIYPLPCGLYRIHIDRKPEIPLFGPLFNGAIVDHKVLPGLVRATAINAIVESPSDSSLALPTSLSQNEISQNNNNSKANTIETQVSPTPSRQSRGSLDPGEKSGHESSFMRHARRLSQRRRKNSAGRITHPTSPPSSPKSSSPKLS